MAQKNKDFFKEFLYDLEEDEVIDVIEFSVGYVPITVERISDGELLYLNKDNKTYSFKEFKNAVIAGQDYSLTQGLRVNLKLLVGPRLKIWSQFIKRLKNKNIV